MNDETKIKLQAYLDGELSDRETLEVFALLNTDADAKIFFAELQFVKAAMAGNEQEIKLPESREFYWSKIQREIERSEKDETTASGFAWWKPAYMRLTAGFAVMCALLMISFIAFNGGTSKIMTGEVEGNGDDMGSITYHSDSDQMTVVYLFDREQDKMIDSNTN